MADDDAYDHEYTAEYARVACDRCAFNVQVSYSGPDLGVAGDLSLNDLVMFQPRLLEGDGEPCPIRGCEGTRQVQRSWRAD